MTNLKLNATHTNNPNKIHFNCTGKNDNSGDVTLGEGHNLSIYLNKTYYDNAPYVKRVSWPSFDLIESIVLPIGEKVTSDYLILSSALVDVIGKRTDTRQKIIFGPPGTGKSNLVNSYDYQHKFQTVFHPEYTYGDFIAKLMPITEDNGVKYKVVAGHFIKALAKALKEPKQSVLLQIDEINRGNCAAIFGDIFQLLDRGIDGKSSYRAHLSELALKALEQELDLPPNQPNQTKFEEIKKDGAYIPANLSIIATMNTSDESVYFMDSAFKRRWQFQYLDADHGADDTNKTQVEACVKYEVDSKTCEITWDCLRRSINNFLICNASTIRGIEDKQIGLWFIKAQADKTISQQDIQYKLMHYLWDNVFARDKKPLRTLLNKKTTELATFGRFVIFKDDFVREVKAYKDNSPCPTEALPQS
jgi:hypothetical protein